MFATKSGIRNKTTFIRDLTVDVEYLTACAGSEGVKAECARLGDAVRFSDPKSDKKLEPIEEKILVQKTSLVEAIEAEDEELVKTIVDNILALLVHRNQMCKAIKK